MRMKFQAAFRGLLALLIFSLGLALYAAVLTTNAPVADTNQPSALVKGMERLSEHPLTFKLDEIGILRDYDFLGEPLWKYLASLLYILLALYAAKLIDLLTNVWLKRLASRTQPNFDDLLLELLRGPI